MKYSEEDDLFSVSGSLTREQRQIVARVPGRLYLNNRWEVPGTDAGREAIKTLGGFVPARRPITDLGEPWKEIPLLEDDLPAGLRPYQVEAIRYLEWREGSGIIGDEQGTGKTVISCSWLAYRPDLLPAVIIVKSTAKPQWERQFLYWCGSPVEILEGVTPRPLDGVSVILNWDILDAWAPELLRAGFRSLIADEVQAAGNPDAKRTQAMMALAATVESFVPMSGTPALSRVAQMWPVLKTLAPGRFPEYQTYLNRYCNPVWDEHARKWKYNGLTNAEDLKRRLSGLILRREKKDVMPWLPPKTREAVLIPTDETQDLSELAEARDLERRMEKMAAVAFGLKRRGVLNWITDWLDEGSGKLLIFTLHHPVIDWLGLHLPGSVTVDGRVTGRKRIAALDRFREDPGCRVLLGNIQACGESIDGLQEAADTCAVVEFPWSPGLCVQAEDRLHRGNQKNPVTAFYLFGQGTLDERILSVMTRRAKMFDRLLPGAVCQEIDILRELIKEAKEGSYDRH